MELIDIVDENNQITGQVEDRMVAYEKGLWRRVVSCWIINEKGNSNLINKGYQDLVEMVNETKKPRP